MSIDIRNNPAAVRSLLALVVAAQPGGTVVIPADVRERITRPGAPDQLLTVDDRDDGSLVVQVLEAT
jgi:hypothetical protein